jgi:hypothetical protein
MRPPPRRCGPGAATACSPRLALFACAPPASGRAGCFREPRPALFPSPKRPEAPGSPSSCLCVARAHTRTHTWASQQRGSHPGSDAAAGRPAYCRHGSTRRPRAAPARIQALVAALVSVDSRHEAHARTRNGHGRHGAHAQVRRRGRTILRWTRGLNPPAGAVAMFCRSASSCVRCRSARLPMSGVPIPPACETVPSLSHTSTTACLSSTQDQRPKTRS